MTKAKTMDIDFLRSILDYNTTTGQFTWKNRPDTPFANARVGKIAGSVNKDGHLVVQIKGLRWPAHRLAWAITHGEWPKGDIDHKFGDRSDNAIDNLRPATRRQNLRNMKLRSSNKSGFKWVSYSPQTKKKWRAQIRNDRTNIYLGSFDTPEEAHEVAKKKAVELHGEFARFE
jgi:hypothetical protein